MSPLRRVPHVGVLIFGLIIVAAIAGLFIEPGGYERDEDGRVVPNTYRLDAERPADDPAPDRPSVGELPLEILMAPLRGIADAGEIIAFLLLIGGAFKVIDRSGAFTGLIHATVRGLHGRGYMLIPVSMTLFSIGGAVFGMAEEIIPFVLLFVPMVRAFGYPAIVGVAIPMIGSGVGFAGAMLNPFTVGVAQAIAGLTPISGWPLRTVCWILLTTIGIAYVSYFARRVPEEPDAPPMDEDHYGGDTLSGRQVGILAILAGGIVVMVAGIAAYKWYVIEIGAIFFAIGLLSGAVARFAPSEIAETFVQGARDLLPAAIVVGFARGIVLLSQDLRILDPILHAMAEVLGGLPGALGLNLMFVFQSCLNLLVPSGSGQAALTMPIMAPLAELSGLTRQQAVLAFQFGDGFSNMIIPTSAVLMGALEAAHVRYESWFRFAWRLQLLLVAFGLVALSVAVGLGYGAS
jgi:uncharacterized ion transporter superfamily protein YfcC